MRKLASEHSAEKADLEKQMQEMTEQIRNHVEDISQLQQKISTVSIYLSDLPEQDCQSFDSLAKYESLDFHFALLAIAKYWTPTQLIV